MADNERQRGAPSTRMSNLFPWLAALIVIAVPARAEWWNAGGRVRISFESRARYEERTGSGFGREPDVATGLVRTRLGVTYRPVSWLKLSGMLQDSRAPWYGRNAPSTVRDSADLHESYLELLPERKKGFGMMAGRAMLNYGEGRLIGTPQWGNLARTYDHARLYYRMPRARLELLFVSPVKIRIGEFNRPVLSDHAWGVYNSFRNLDVYVLRHNASGLRVNTIGFRAAGPLALGVKYSVEGAAQNGRVGPARHRGAAWFSGLSRRWLLHNRPLDVSGEYKYASGTRNPRDPGRIAAFDQLYPANHDKFGHQDLFGWRNIHNLRSLAALELVKNLALNSMYNNSWLASARDALYNGVGRPIARSAGGADGRHVGQELDVFLTYKYKHFLIGIGYGRLFAGEFLKKTTPGVGPTYVYLFHTFSL